LLKLSSGDIAEHDSATSFLRAIGKCQTALHRPRRKHAGDAFKTQLDGCNFLPFLKGDVAERPRKELFYFADASFTSAADYILKRRLL
jgi:hypothetical protein